MKKHIEKEKCGNIGISNILLCNKWGEDMPFERISWKGSRNARNRAHKIKCKVQSALKDQYTFTPIMVGSAKTNTIVADDLGAFDVDFQIQISNSYTDEPNRIKNDFFVAFQNVIQSNEIIENSTTAITIKVYTDLSHRIEMYSFDFVLIKKRNIIKRNGPNLYTWNILPEYHLAYNIFEKIDEASKYDIIDNHIIPRKIIEKRKNSNIRKSSSDIFVEEVYNYAKAHKII
jgi:hypothetical protein